MSSDGTIILLVGSGITLFFGLFAKWLAYLCGEPWFDKKHSNKTLVSKDREHMNF